jgi:hypothetical protein
MMHSTILKAAAVVAASVLAACSGTPEEHRAVTLNGEIKMVAGPVPAGTIHLRLYNLWYLEGELRHPLEEILDLETNTSTFSHTFDYPVHKGTGFAVHAWIDTDDDGAFCTPSSHTDPSGLAWSEESPAEEISLAITLTDNCRAANFFYPPKAE